MRELELKLSVDDPFVTPALRPDGVDLAGMEELPSLDLRATYYDTHDLRLARNGVSLRYRTGDPEQSGWTLKLPLANEDASARDELHFSGAVGKIPAAARDLVTAFARSSPLEPVARLRTRRQRWCLRAGDGTELAELVDDRVSVTKEGRVIERFRELELESRALDRPALERIAAMLQEAGASEPRPIPKVVRALGPRATLPPDVVPRSRVSPQEPAAHAVQAAITRGVQRILTNDPGSRLGQAEAVHQMRVGTRRLRSDLRTFASLVEPSWAEDLRSELRWLGGALGGVRDIDVMQERLHAAATDLDGLEPLFGQLEEQHLVARAGLLKVLRSERYRSLLERLVDAAQGPPVTAAAWSPCAERLPPLAARAWERLARRGRSAGPDTGDADLHQVRILAKRSRYAAEAIGPALGRKRGRKAARFARGAAHLQEVLGELQDSAVARGLITEAASSRPGDGRFNLPAGRLLERQELAARNARGAFEGAWRELDRPKLVRWLSE